MKNLKSPSQWKGVWTALITPFQNDKTLDEISFKNLIEKQILAGITGLVIAGSTGEGSLLDDQQYEAVLKKALEFSNGRIPLVAGLGIGGTRECLKRGRIAKGAGVAGLLASPPAYIKTPARGLVEHFLEIAKLEVPLCLYDVPGRSAQALPDEVIDQLISSKDPAAQFICALKDASGKPERLIGKDFWKEKLALLSGDDESFVQFVKNGGHGIISVATHFAMRDFAAVLKNPVEAAPRFEKIMPFIGGLYWESNPIPTKSLCKKLGWIAGDTFQAPLIPMKADLLEKLNGLYRESFS